MECALKAIDDEIEQLRIKLQHMEMSCQSIVLAMGQDHMQQDQQDHVQQDCAQQDRARVHVQDTEEHDNVLEGEFIPFDDEQAPGVVDALRRGLSGGVNGIQHMLSGENEDAMPVISAATMQRSHSTTA